MRMLAVFAVIAMTGCVSNGTGTPAGKLSADGGPVSVERLGTMMPIAASSRSLCHSEQVLLCRGEADDGDCRCVFILDAERSLERGTHDRQGFRTGRPH